jgi:hypothetical protein
MKWLATYIGEAPRFLCSSKGLEWAPGETKEIDEETALLIRESFPDLVRLEQVEEPPPGKKQRVEPPAEEPVPDDTTPAEDWTQG